MKTKLLLLLFCCNISLLLNAQIVHFEYNGYRYMTYWYEGSNNDEIATWEGVAENNTIPANFVLPTSTIYYYSK